MTGTVSVHDDGTAELDAEPCLVRVLRCEAPLDAPVRVPLQGATSIVLGRGDAEVTRAGSEITVRVPDDRMSTIHARLARTGRKLVITDQGSKNGTIVNGRRIETHELADGDVLEIGHTFFIYRYAPTGLGAAPAVVADGDGELALATFVPSLARQYDSLARVAPSMVPVVVLGETGTGKEVVARAAHRMSGRSGPFVAINCGAIPANLIECELFGAKKGAFTGATEDRAGLVREADGGTLFLDEIAELPEAAQVALLRVLQEREVLPVGGTRPVPVDVRLLAATHQPLDRLVDAERFRSDLYARLGGLHLKLPALRERRDDLGLIIASADPADRGESGAGAAVAPDRGGVTGVSVPTKHPRARDLARARDHDGDHARRRLHGRARAPARDPAHARAAGGCRRRGRAAPGSARRPAHRASRPDRRRRARDGQGAHADPPVAPAVRHRHRDVPKAVTLLRVTGCA